MPDIITRIFHGKTASRIDYITRSNLHQAWEGPSRPAFILVESGLKRGRAATYRRGPNKVNGALDLVVSFGDNNEIAGLGDNAATRQANRETAVRGSLAELETSLWLQLRRAASLKQNTAHRHLPILISRARFWSKGRAAIGSSPALTSPPPASIGTNPAPRRNALSRE